jgi:hypothetical protein
MEFLVQKFTNRPQGKLSSVYERPCAKDVSSISLLNSSIREGAVSH